MGVAAGRGVSMWPPCKERQNQMSLAMPAHPTAVCTGSGHITSQSDAGCLGQWWRWALGSIRQGTGSLCLGTKLWSCWGRERRGGEQGPEQTLAGTLWSGRSPLGACLRSRKERREPTLAGHTGVSWASKTTSSHRTKETLWQTCKDTLQGAQGKERSQEHPGKDSLSLSARMCPQWNTSLLPPHGSTTARLLG